MTVQTDAGDYDQEPRGWAHVEHDKNSAMDLFRDAAQEEHVV